jgi:hypothetical protein
MTGGFVAPQEPTGPTATAHRPDGVDFRIILVGVALFIAAVFFVFGQSPGDRATLWRAMGVPALQPTFADTRVITSAWECTRRGFDVLIENPCDPWARPMNYPRVWLLPAVTGLGQSSTDIIGIVTALLFLLSTLILIGRITLGETILYGLVLGSPAVLLAIERGNNDLLVFALCVAALRAIQNTAPGRRFVGTALLFVGTALLFVAAVLKLYPAFALASLVTRARWAIGALVALAVYALLISGDLRLIYDATPKPTLFAYGVIPVGALISIPAELVAVGLLLVTAAVATRPTLARFGSTSAAPLNQDAFLMGSALYIGSFLLGSDWVYRLVFLIFVVPQLIEWVHLPPTQVIGITLLAGVLGLLWLSRFTQHEPGTAAFQVLSLPLFVLLGGISLRVLVHRWSLSTLPGNQLLTRLVQPGSLI